MTNRPFHLSVAGRLFRGWLCSGLFVGVLSCSSPVVFDTIHPEIGHETPICFGNAFVDHVLSTRSTGLNSHTETMGVWAWYEYEQSTYPLFVNQLVRHGLEGWSYTPLKYWNPLARYRFSAYAPHDSEVSQVEASIDEQTGFISLSNVSLSGVNLQLMPSSALKQSFKDSTDIDWLICREGTQHIGAQPFGVEFVMQHILSKLNVRIRKSEALDESGGIEAVWLDSLSVVKLSAQGSFTQQHRFTPHPDSVYAASSEEWTVSPEAKMQIRSGHHIGLQNQWIYVLESLTLPQSLSDEAQLKLTYSLQFNDKRIEHCVFCLRLNQIFPRFVSGSSYVLSLTVGAERILFNAGSTNWHEAEQYTIINTAQ